MSGAAELVVVSVGTDHHPFDRLVGWMDRWAAEHCGVRVVIQRGNAAPTEHAESQSLIPHGDLCDLFARATAVVTHGGPSTVMDIRAAGRLPIVFPRDPAHGEHIDDHQLRFGQHLARQQLAKIVYEHHELGVALDEAFERPDCYLVPFDPKPAPGVVAFGRIVDELIGVVTPTAPQSSKAVGQLRPESTGFELDGAEEVR